MKKLSEKEFKQRISAAKKVLKRLQNPKETLPVYKICRKFDIYESELHYIIKKHLKMADELKAAMKKRRSKVFSVARTSGTDDIKKVTQKEKLAEKSRQEIEEFGQQEKAKTKQKFECYGCGTLYEAEPVICGKCNGLRFQIVNIPVCELKI